MKAFKHENLYKIQMNDHAIEPPVAYIRSQMTWGRYRNVVNDGNDAV